jgi:hypothetical protein
MENDHFVTTKWFFIGVLHQQVTVVSKTPRKNKLKRSGSGHFSFRSLSGSPLFNPKHEG